MKIAISVPGEISNPVSERDAASITVQIDHAMTLAGNDDSSNAAVIIARRHLAPADEW